MTFVSQVNRMIAAESSRITPTKMKHQVAITLVRSSGAVMWLSACSRVAPRMRLASSRSGLMVRSEEHTSELQSPDHLVCRLLLEKKKKKKIRKIHDSCKHEVLEGKRSG